MAVRAVEEDQQLETEQKVKTWNLCVSTMQVTMKTTGLFSKVMFLESNLVEFSLLCLRCCFHMMQKPIVWKVLSKTIVMAVEVASQEKSVFFEGKAALARLCLQTGC